MPHTRPLRTLSALIGAGSLAALLALSATPAVAADAPWSAPVEVQDAYGDAGATVVSPDGTITVVTESAAGVVAASSTDGGLTWGEQVVLSTQDYAYRPAVAVTSSGLLAATWIESINNVSSIVVSVSSDRGATWSTPEPAPTVSGSLDDPVLGSASANGFTLVWNEGFAKLSSSTTDGGATWSPAAVVTENMNSYGRASLAAVGAGEIVVVFQEFDGNAARYSIQSKRSTDGGVTWSPKAIVGSDWSGILGNGLYSFGVSPAAGTVVAVWSHGTEDGDALFAATSSDGGATWGAEFGVGSPAGFLRYFSVQAISPTSVGVIWLDETGDGSTIRYSTVTVGAASTPAPVTLAESATYAFDYIPSFAALGDARVASWLEYTGDDEVTYVTSVSCDAGATWSTPAVLATGEDLAEQNAQVVVSGATFSAFWRQDASGATGQSLFVSSLTAPCGAVIPSGPALAATGAPVLPAALLALVVLALGAGVLVARRRVEV